MIIGVPKEVKVQEERVAVTPHGVREFVRHGHQVLVEQGAGVGSGFPDREYVAAGATIVPTAADVWAQAEMIMKVKEPIPAEYPYLRPGLVLFTYLHLAADEALTRTLLDRQVTAIAYETVQLADGSLPLLAPMSEVAGRLAVQVAAYYLMRPHGGRGVLLGGVAGVSAANVVILGGGIVGTNAAQMALGLGANVTLLDINVDRLRFLEQILHGRFHTLMSNQQHIADAVEQADVVISGVLIPGARAPRLVTREMVASMRRGSVIVDVSIDQGGSIETSRPTTHADPVYEEYGVVHYCVTNMPGSVPRTSTFALSNVTLSYGLKLADLGVVEAVRRDPALARGVNTYQGKVTHPSVASAFGLPYTPLETLLAPSPEQVSAS
ncbi:alanine dehydrogenase [Thermorudis peleae]|uniref:alanine dehydrogenase n=1 Tax=Thermorudis peleae TaxID=1382356 RepID=UPI000571DA35|nr:alanine dehydrogenase [Thermorudis peleae]MBX6754806.1 alanine dehydrogenase [Thermorudis peleae]